MGSQKFECDIAFGGDLILYFVAIDERGVGDELGILSNVLSRVVIEVYLEVRISAQQCDGYIVNRSRFPGVQFFGVPNHCYQRWINSKRDRHT